MEPSSESYQQFNALFEKITQGIDSLVEAELNRLRETEPEQWMRLHQHLRSLVEPPAVGTVGQQMQAVRSKIDYLTYQVRPDFPQVIGRLLASANRHYAAHHQQLAALTDFFTLDNSSNGEMVSEFIKRLSTDPPPPAAS